MQATDTSKAEIITGIAGTLVGLGAVTMALFPLALPILVLLAVLAIPLVPIAIIGAMVAAAGLGVRSLARRAGGRRRRTDSSRAGVAASPRLLGQTR